MFLTYTIILDYIIDGLGFMIREETNYVIKEQRAQNNLSLSLSLYIYIYI